MTLCKQTQFYVCLIFSYCFSRKMYLTSCSFLVIWRSKGLIFLVNLVNLSFFIPSIFTCLQEICEIVDVYLSQIKYSIMVHVHNTFIIFYISILCLLVSQFLMLVICVRIYLLIRTCCVKDIFMFKIENWWSRHTFAVNTIIYFVKGRASFLNN